MKKGLIAATCVALLAGCSSGLSEEEYFDLVHQTPGLSQYADNDLRTIGGNICDVFEQGGDYTSALAAMIDSGMTAGDAGALIAFSVSQYCPDRLDDLPKTSS